MPNRGDADRKPGPQRETLVGSVERVTFHNADTGFAVLKVKARGRRDLVPVVGHAASISAGEYIHAVGVWLTDRTHGLQFKADLLKTTPPTTKEGMARYLGSGMVRGIGPKLAERIVGQFGLDTFEVIEADPSKLQEVLGHRRVPRWEDRGWLGRAESGSRHHGVLCTAMGSAPREPCESSRPYGHDAIAIMTDDPYRLARDIRGIGFRSADVIAMRLGLTKELPKRLRAGVSYALQTATDEGHCALPVEELVRLAEKLLEVPGEPIRVAIEAELAEGGVVLDRIEEEPCLFLKGLHSAERDVAERLKVLARGDLPWPKIDVERAIPWVEERTGKTLSPSQRAAVDLVLRSKVAVVTGGPGVGKTTLLDTILRILKAKGVRLLLAAPTGRAAKRMSEQTGHRGQDRSSAPGGGPEARRLQEGARRSSRMRSSRHR